MLAFTEMILETLRESPMLKYLKLRISGGYVLESLLGGPHLPSAGGAPPSRVISVSPLGSPTLRLPLPPRGVDTGLAPPSTPRPSQAPSRFRWSTAKPAADRSTLQGPFQEGPFLGRGGV